MSLWMDLEAMAARCKHGDTSPDSDEVLALCRRAQRVDELLSRFVSASEWMAYRTGDGGRLRVTVDCDDGAWFMADLVEALQ